MIQSYNDFVKALLSAGFSMAGGSDDGIYAIISWGWNEPPPYETPINWHTGDPETDPWEWRIRVIEERSDIAYGKLFFKKSGFITKDWYPCFLAARRGISHGTNNSSTGNSIITFDEAYDDGTISHFAKRIYEVIEENETLPLHLIKQEAGFTKEDKSGFDRALTELQMKMFLTMCDCQQKVSQMGKPFAWSSTVFCTTERFFGEEVFKKAEKINKEEAHAKIKEQILKLNPSAQEKKIEKFIFG